MAMLTTGIINLDKDKSVQSISYDDLTAFDCQHAGGKHKARYAVICSFENPAYQVNCLDATDEEAKSAETAKSSFELHLTQAYRILAGQRMTREYKAQYGIKSNLGKNAWKLAKLCFIFGIGWATAFWLLFSVFVSIDTKKSYMDLIMDIEGIIIYFGGGLLFGLTLWVVLFLLSVRMQSRR
jgi:hypothetical protein